MRVIALPLLILALAAPAAASGFPDIIQPLRTGQTATQDAAVIISVEAYHSSINSDVPHAHRDGDAMESYLLYTRGVPSERITRLKGTDCQTLRYEVQHAAKQVGPKGTLWIYFSGHGSRAEVTRDGRRRGEHVLVCDDARDNRFFFSKTVPVPELQRMADASKAQRAVLMIDACYGATGRDGKQKTVRKMAGAATLVALPKVVVWSATATGEQAKALDGAQHGAFTYLALGALRGWADGEISGRRDGAVTISEAQAFVRRGLRAVRLIGQTPVASGPKGVLGWTLASGVEEKAPALRAPSAARVRRVRTHVGGAQDIAAMAAEVATAEMAADAARKAVEAAKQRRAAAEKKLMEERERRLTAAEEDVQAAAAREYAAIRGFVSHPRAAGQRVLDAFLKKYSNAKVSYGGIERAVTIKQLDLVKVALLKTVADSQRQAQRQLAGSEETLYRPKLVTLPGGEFKMGSEPGQSGGDDERQHVVEVSPFEMMATEVTQRQYAALRRSSPSLHGPCANCPVETVSWYDAVSYANALSKKEGRVACYLISGGAVTWRDECDGYRLPTEAEWEYAARAGTEVARHRDLDDFAWWGEGDGGTHPVGTKAPNTWGLFDMLGNVSEWCWDRWAPYEVTFFTPTDPRGPTSGPEVVVRGGSFSSSKYRVRFAYRDVVNPGYHRGYIGFRLVRRP